MQQLQSLYRGDSSSSLAQIFGMQYQPQQATSQTANTAISSGMSAGAQVKTTAMNNATQIGIADANRFQQGKQFMLSHALATKTQADAASNAERMTDWTTYGQFVQKDTEAAGSIEAKIGELTTTLNQLPKDSEQYLAVLEEIENLRATANRAAGRGVGGLSGAAGYGGVDKNGNNPMTQRGIQIATLNQALTPSAPAPAPVSTLPGIPQTPGVSLAPAPAPAPAAPAPAPAPATAAVTSAPPPAPPPNYGQFTGLKEPRKRRQLSGSSRGGVVF